MELDTILRVIGVKFDHVATYMHDRRARRGKLPYLPRFGKYPMCIRLWDVDEDTHVPNCCSAVKKHVVLKQSSYHDDGRLIDRYSDKDEEGSVEMWTSDPGVAVHLSAMRHLVESGLFEMCPEKAVQDFRMCEKCMQLLGGPSYFQQGLEAGQNDPLDLAVLPVVYPEVGDWWHSSIHAAEGGQKRLIGSSATFVLRGVPHRLFVLVGEDLEDLARQSIRILANHIDEARRTLTLGTTATCIRRPSIRKKISQRWMMWMTDNVKNNGEIPNTRNHDDHVYVHFFSTDEDDREESMKMYAALYYAAAPKRLTVASVDA